MAGRLGANQSWCSNGWTNHVEGERIDVVLYSNRLDPQPRTIHRVALEQGQEIGAIA